VPLIVPCTTTLAVPAGFVPPGSMPPPILDELPPQAETEKPTMATHANRYSQPNLI
jgi:hypothetical protein